MSSPIALFAYRRPEHLRRTIASLKANELAADSTLYIFCDGAKHPEHLPEVEAVADVARAATGFAHVECVFRDHNLGLANSIIGGVSRVLSEHSQVIVIEDDLELSPLSLRWFNTTLEYYRDHPKVFSISGYRPPESAVPHPTDWPYDAFFLPRIMSWGWATWSDRWNRCDWRMDGPISTLANADDIRAYASTGSDKPRMLALQRDGMLDSWAIRFDWNQFHHQGLTVYPRNSYVFNTGHDGSGTHCGTTERFAVNLDRAMRDPRLPLQIIADPMTTEGLRRFYDPTPQSPSLAKRAINKAWRLLSGRNLWS